MPDTVKIIATVGASILTNFNHSSVQEVLKEKLPESVSFGHQLTTLLRDQPIAPEKLEEIERWIAGYFLWNMRLEYDQGVKPSRKWAFSPDSTGINAQASAEIQSMLEMLKNPAFQNKAIQLFLLCTDTIVSRLSAKLIQQALEIEMKSRGVDFLAETKIVKGLRVLDKKKFEDEGFDGLFQTITDIHYQAPQQAMTCLNVTGGYKSLLPILTIIAQLYKYPLYYVFEFSNAGSGKDVLLEIPPLPLQFDWAMVDLWSPYLSQKSIARTTLSAAEDSLFRQQLLPNRLFSLIADQTYRRTNLGAIFHNYIERQTPHGKTVLGYMVEYKCFDWYLKEPVEGFQAQHSVELDGVEMDILLTQADPKEYVWVEVKSFNQICHAYYKSTSGRDNFNPKLSRYLKQLKPETLLQIKAFHLLVYCQRFQEVHNDYFNKNLGKIKKKLETAGIRDFKVFVFDIDLDLDSESLSSQQNPYTQRLMNRRLTTDKTLSKQPHYLLMNPYQDYMIGID